MTQDTSRQDAAIALVRAYYDAFNRGDRAAMLDLLAEDVVHDLNQGARETGREAHVSSTGLGFSFVTLERDLPPRPAGS